MNDGDWIVADCPGTNCLRLLRKILAEQRQRRGVVTKVFEQNCKGLGYLAVRPIVADAVAQAIDPGNVLLMLIAMVVTLPVSGMLKHHLLDDCAQIGTPFLGNPLFLNS